MTTALTAVYQPSSILQRLLKRLQKECNLQLPVDRKQYLLKLTRGVGYQKWTAEVPYHPEFGVIEGIQTLSVLVCTTPLKLTNKNVTNSMHYRVTAFLRKKVERC